MSLLIRKLACLEAVYKLSSRNLEADMNQFGMTENRIRCSSNFDKQLHIALVLSTVCQ